MTGAAELLDDLTRRGVVLSASDDGLLYDAPPGMMTPELRARLAEHKEELLSILRGPGLWGRWAAALVRVVTPDPRRRADLLAWYQERAGVLEYDANLSRDAAEERALHQLLEGLAADRRRRRAG